MNTSKRKLTLQQERLAYRRAVRNILSVFFDKSPEEAGLLVNSWWKRMGNSPVFTTGLFMHDEPLNTAADLAGAARTPAIRELGEAYLQIIQQSKPGRRARPKQRADDKARAAHAA